MTDNAGAQGAPFDDEFSGQGGSYVLENGKRRLVHRTEVAPAAPDAVSPSPAAPVPGADHTQE